VRTVIPLRTYKRYVRTQNVRIRPLYVRICCIAPMYVHVRTYLGWEGLSGGEGVPPLPSNRVVHPYYHGNRATMTVLHPITMVIAPCSAVTVTMDAFPQWFPPHYPWVGGVYGVYATGPRGGTVAYAVYSVPGGHRASCRPTYTEFGGGNPKKLTQPIHMLIQNLSPPSKNVFSFFFYSNDVGNNNINNLGGLHFFI
jgi:hypothetical protein